MKLVFDEYADSEGGRRAVSREALAGLVEDVWGGSRERSAQRER